MPGSSSMLNIFPCITNGGGWTHGLDDHLAGYVVLRAAEFFDVDDRLARTQSAHMHDFAVIWEDPGDQAVIEVTQSIYLAGLLGPVVFIVERHGHLTFFVERDEFYLNAGRGWNSWTRKVEQICLSYGGDRWSVEFGAFSKLTGDLFFEHNVHPNILTVSTFMRILNVDWNLCDRKLLAAPAELVEPPVRS